MSFHDNLRGVCCIWIMIFHIVLRLKNNINLQGNSLMPLFFILSGITQAYYYYDRFINNLSTFEFMKKRVKKIIWPYIISNVMMIPLSIHGYGIEKNLNEVYINIPATLFHYTTLFGYTIGRNLNSPSWTISTLLFWWILTPATVRKLYKYETPYLFFLLKISYWLQLILCLLSYTIVILTLGESALIFSTMNPIIRFPVYLMGLIGGVLKKRNEKMLGYFYPKYTKISPVNIIEDEEDKKEENEAECKIEIKETNETKKEDMKDSDFHLGDCQTENIGDYERTHLNMLVSMNMILFMVVIFIDNSLKIIKGIESNAEIWFQSILPLIQFNLVYCSMLKTDAIDLKYFGDISLYVYLYHWPILRFCLYITNNFKSRFNDKKDDMILPFFMVPVVISCTMLIAHLHYKYKK